MKSPFCFTINGEQHCIDIPVLVERFPRKPEPDPEPWLKGFKMSADTIRDLSVLASINEVGNVLKTPGLQKQFTQFMRGTIGHLNLPKEVQVHFEQQYG